MRISREVHAAASDGVELFCRDFGPDGASPVVLCHGLGANGEQFLEDAAYWAARGRRVLVPDLRGHGRSGRPKGAAAADYTIEVMARDMLAVLDAAGARRVHWVGNSLGGIVALHLIAVAPQRFASLATFGTAYSLSLPPAVGHAIPLLYRSFGALLTAQVTAAMTTRDRPARRLIAAMLRQFDPMTGRAVAQNVARYDLRAEAATFEGPMLLLRGGRDNQVNAALGPTLGAMRGRRNFSVVELPGGGHCANLDAPAAMRAALEQFWAWSEA